MARDDGQPDKTTIFDVAGLAGVSIKTVSRVLNDEPNVRSSTRKKVLQAVADLNYQPSAAARGLGGGKSYAIGLAYENPNEFSYVGAVLSGALQACEAEKYSLLLRPLNLPNPRLLEDIGRFARQARLDGIILPAPIGNHPRLLQGLRRLGLKLGTISPSASSRGVINVDCDDEPATFRLVEHLVSLGHSRLGFIKGDPNHGSSEKRFAGYRRALKAHGIRYQARLVCQGNFDFASGKAAADRLLKLREAPTAIMASNDDMAAGAIFRANELGYAVPDAVSVTGFDDTPAAARIWPPLTTVRQPIREMTDAVTRLLVRSIRGERVPRPDTFACEIIVRSSSGACREAQQP